MLNYRRYDNNLLSFAEAAASRVNLPNQPVELTEGIRIAQHVDRFWPIPLSIRFVYSLRVCVSCSNYTNCNIEIHKRAIIYMYTRGHFSDKVR